MIFKSDKKGRLMSLKEEKMFKVNKSDSSKMHKSIKSKSWLKTTIEISNN